MNVFNKVTLQGLKKSRTRTIVTVIGVILSAAMITAVATFGVSLLDYMTKGAMQKYGNWHAAFLDADSAFVQEQAGSGEVAAYSTFENIGYAPLNSGKNPNKPYLFVAGYNEKTLDALPVTLFSGRMPKNSSELLVSGSISAKAGVDISVGDTLSLALGNRMNGNEKLNQNDPYLSGGETLVTQKYRTYTVVGVCQTPSYEEDSSPGYTLITMSDGAAAGTAGADNGTANADDFSLFIALKNPRDVHSYVENVAGSHSYVLNNNVLRFMGLSTDPADKLFTTLLFSAGAIVIAIIMLGSIFLIYNSFNISLNERTQQFGILASVGASAKQLRNSVLFEGLCIGAVGIPIGVIVGIASIGAVLSVVSKNFSSILYSGVPLTLNLSAAAIICAAAVSLTTILISAYIPARKAANTPVMECIRQTNEVKVDTKAVKTSRLAQKLYGLEGTLALKNFKRNKKRYRSIVLSLVLSMVLFVSTSAFVTNLTQTTQQTNSVTDYDIGFGTRQMDDGELLQLFDKLKTADGLTESSFQVVMNVIFQVRADQLSAAYWDSLSSDAASSAAQHSPDESAAQHSPDEMAELSAEIQFFDDSSYQRLIDGLGLPVEEYTGPNAKLAAAAKMEDNSGQAEDVTQLADLFTASSVNAVLSPRSSGGLNGAEAQSGASTITCVEFVPPDVPPVSGGYEQKPYVLQILAPYSLMESIAPSASQADIRVKGLTFLSLAPTQSAAEMNVLIQGSEITASYLFWTTSELFEESRNYIFIANVFSYTFIIMISLIAVANVFNTISTNIKLRRRELAMLRSVGMSDRDFNKMMRFECAFYGMRALLYGLPLSILLSWLIYKGMFIGGAETIRFEMPWVSLGISVFTIFLVVFTTMLYAVSKIRKENIIDALRDDMT